MKESDISWCFEMFEKGYDEIGIYMFLLKKGLKMDRIRELRYVFRVTTKELTIMSKNELKPHSNNYKGGNITNDRHKGSIGEDKEIPTV